MFFSFNFFLFFFVKSLFFTVVKKEGYIIFFRAKKATP